MKYSIVLSASIVLSSCVGTGIVSGLKVETVCADRVVSMERDTSFHCCFDEIVHCNSIQIVNDTIIVFQEHPHEGDPYHFKAYSLNTFSYLGSLVNVGRGPGEMITPHIAKSNIYAEYLNLYDNSLSQAYLIDVEKSLKSQRPEIAKVYDLPYGAVEWMPMRDGGQFVLQCESDEFVFCALDTDRDNSKGFRLYEGLNADKYSIFLSSFLVDNAGTSYAEILVFLPQINIIDPSAGIVRSLAVNGAYRNWKTIINRRFDMNVVQYYTGAVSSEDFIFAAYNGYPVGELNSETRGTSIHVFDWKGNFLIDVSVSENIGAMAYDPNSKYLYCVDNIGGRVIRYDMSLVV